MPTGDDALRRRVLPVLHVHGPNAPQRVDVQEPYFYAALRQGHPWINIGWIVVKIDEDVVMLTQIEPSGDVTQRQRSRPHESNLGRV